MVLGVDEEYSVATDRQKSFFSNHRPGVRQSTMPQKSAIDLLVLDREVRGVQCPTSTVDELHRAADSAYLGMSLHEFDLPLEAIPDGDIVGVHPRDVLALGEAAPPVERDDQALVFLVVDPHPRI